MPRTAPTVPIAADGLEGWTSCCDACVTYSGDGVLCCKACWNEVDTVALDPANGAALSVIVTAVINGDITPDEGVRRQAALLATATTTPTDHAPAATITPPMIVATLNDWRGGFAPEVAQAERAFPNAPERALYEIVTYLVGLHTTSDLGHALAPIVGSDTATHYAVRASQLPAADPAHGYADRPGR